MAIVHLSARGLRVLRRDLHHLWLLTNRSQLDEEAAQTTVLAFLAISSPSTSGSVAADDCSTFVLGEDGELSVFGRVDFELPPGPFLSVHAGQNRLCALRKNGELVCMGEFELEMPEELGFVVAFASCEYHACAVKATGELV